MASDYEFEGGYVPDVRPDFVFKENRLEMKDLATAIEEITLKLLDPTLTTKQKAHLRLQKKHAKQEFTKLASKKLKERS